jgi:aspartyl-tRNA(Asn)/glutamyl-tRNA(Gln) amidotransferase subunit B
MAYEAVIGLEIHAQLLTDTKIFCGCQTAFGAGPNTQTCPVCTGMPGVLPVMNRKAIEYVIRTGIALNCHISQSSRFARKNYFYPDLPKGYQISQYELPLCEHGYVEVSRGEPVKSIRLTRIHLEEDAGKNIHEGRGDYSLVDLNRAGVPLMEIVTEPDIGTPEEAVQFMKRLRTILRYLGVCDGNMEQGSLRCDANVSVRPVGQGALGVKTEIKNMNSFRFIEKALDYEIKRQKAMLRDGERIIQETRLWDAERGVTESMRSKEEAHDYRYFPEPDLVPVEVDRSWIEEIKGAIVELPDARRERFVKQYELPESDADLLTDERATADWFEEAVTSGGEPKPVSNWIMTELMKLLNEDGRGMEECPLKPRELVDMLGLIDKGVISGKIAKTVFSEMYKTGGKAATIISERGLLQISNEGEIEAVVDDVLRKNAEAVGRFRSGEAKLMGFFVGQVMKITRGKANPAVVNDLLKRKLS